MDPVPPISWRLWDPLSKPPARAGETEQLRAENGRAGGLFLAARTDAGHWLEEEGSLLSAAPSPEPGSGLSPRFILVIIQRLVW